MDQPGVPKNPDIRKPVIWRPRDPSRLVAPSRREFVRLAAIAAAAILPLPPAALHAQRLLGALRDQHPEPRPGIDGSRVIPADQLKDMELIELFDGIRRFPHIADGLRCYCGCAGIEGYRSLLVCYEEPGMARYCLICQGQGRLAVARAREGQTLEQIRRASDARYGSGAVEHERHAHVQRHHHNL